jgi:hypothetical protein
VAHRVAVCFIPKFVYLIFNSSKLSNKISITQQYIRPFALFTLHMTIHYFTPTRNCNIAFRCPTKTKTFKDIVHITTLSPIIQNEYLKTICILISTIFRLMQNIHLPLMSINSSMVTQHTHFRSPVSIHTTPKNISCF